MIKYFGYSEAVVIEEFWKEVLAAPTTSIRIERSDKRSSILFQKDGDTWKAVGFMDIAMEIPTTRKLLDSLMFESNCGAVATIN